MIANDDDDAPKLAHTSAHGDAWMIDVGAKTQSQRTAVATGSIRMSHAAFAAIRDNAVAKGDVLAVARIAGIMAAKRTPELIPLCHVVAVSHASIALTLDDMLPGVRVQATLAATDVTGVEMEAIVAATIALATIYDMAKSVDRAMVISDVRLLSKTGGKSGDFNAPAPDDNTIR